jgi:DNA (cytosine-5)-methyltransferase 1
MRYLSVCSGIEAATVAWHHLGWQPIAFSEIEPFPSAVLAHHYPNVPNLGDMTQFEEWNLEPIDLLVGGTPCQSFSVAGLRKGLADPRGNLMLTYLAIAQRQRPRWIVWENVPGVLSSNGGRDFGTFLGALGELGYGFAYRVLDAQWFGVAQRRRRVFVVGYLGDWQRPAKVLFESESVCRDTPPSRKAGQEVAGTIAARFGNSRNNHEECVPTVAGSLDTECGGGKLTHQSITNGHVIGTITARMFNALGTRDVEEGALLPVGFGAQMSVPQVDVDLMQTLQAKNPMAVAQPIHYRKSRRAQSVNDHETWVEDAVSNTLNCFDVGDVRSTDVVAQPVAPALTASNDPSRSPQSSEVTQQVAAVHAAAMQVRRLTPVECERLQGFPDNYTNIPWRKKAESPDGPRYKALGNSMAVPVMRWIGERINKEDKL